jgi:hypothetical protein
MEHLRRQEQVEGAWQEQRQRHAPQHCEAPVAIPDDRQRRGAKNGKEVVREEQGPDEELQAQVDRADGASGRTVCAMR